MDRSSSHDSILPHTKRPPCPLALTCFVVQLAAEVQHVKGHAVLAHSPRLFKAVNDGGVLPLDHRGGRGEICVQEERAGWQRLGAAAVAAAGGAEAARGSRSARAVVALAAPRCCRRVADVAENAAAAWIVWSLPTEAALPCALQSADAEGARGVALGIVAKDLDDGVMLLGADGFLCCRAGCGGEGENGAGGGQSLQSSALQGKEQRGLDSSHLFSSCRIVGREGTLTSSGPRDGFRLSREYVRVLPEKAEPWQVSAPIIGQFSWQCHRW